MLPTIGRVYDNSHARNTLGWAPAYDFHRAIELLGKGKDYQSPLARQVGANGYHETTFMDEPYPVE